ncbi:MAG: peroxide stress protein YaaA [Bacteroidales bacterium]|nr:peroxide stress protein YaaA [Bacteroidales bacterium]
MNFKPLTNIKNLSVPVFAMEAWEIANKMKGYSPGQLTRLLGVNADLALSTAERFASFREDPLDLTTKPAIFAYSGDVYRGLDSDTLPPASLAFSQEHVRILSALYGVLKPLDAIQPYRLEMNTTLHVNKSKNLYGFWQIKISDVLAKELAADPVPVLINLASQEYFSAINTEILGVRIITPVFKEYRDENYKTLPMYAKLARGKMTRYILEKQINNPEDLKLFDLEGYAYDDNLSNEDIWVFTR